MKIRKAVDGDAFSIATVQVKSWKTTYKGIISEQFLANLSVENRERNWEYAIKHQHEQGNVIFVAEKDEEIVGFASGGETRSKEYPYDRELYAIYLLQEYQRQGIGRQLITTVARELAKKGYQGMIVWVLKENPSKRAYEKLGAKAIGEQDIEIGEETLREVALVWEDLNLF